MSDFRKQMHVFYKKKMHGILIHHAFDLIKDFDGFIDDPGLWTEKWVDANCLPMGDCSKEDAIKEMDAWQGNDSN